MCQASSDFRQGKAEEGQRGLQQRETEGSWEWGDEPLCSLAPFSSEAAPSTCLWQETHHLNSSGVQHSGIKCIHSVVQPLAPTIARTSVFPNCNLVPMKHETLHLPSSQPLATPIPPSVSAPLTALGTLSKWNHKYVPFYVGIISFSKMLARSIHVVASVRISFLCKA